MFCNVIEFAKDLRLDIHILVDSLYYEIAICHRFELQGRREELHPIFHIALRESSVFSTGFIIAANRSQTAIESFLRRFDDRHRNTGVKKIHRDAPAHRAGANDADLFDRQNWRAVGQVIYFPDVSLSKE